MQSRVDLHVHSKYSDRPSEWVLRRIGSPESFTEPMDIYRKCLERGMDFVTISDHNRLDGALSIAHLPNTFLSVELTTYFPENGAKLHVLAFGVTEAQFTHLQKARQSIYDLRRYIVENDIIASVAHPLFRPNDKLTPDEIEKTLVLFNRFEGINGTRDPRASEMVNTIFRALTPEMIERMADRHGIEPVGPTPWIKTFTGGSDDHGGIYVASAYTQTPEASNVEQYLEHLRAGRHEMGGESGSSVMLAHSFYHIAYSYYRAKLLHVPNGRASLLGELLRRLLEQQPAEKPTLRSRARKLLERIVSHHRRRRMHEVERELVDDLGRLFQSVKALEHNPGSNHLSEQQTFDLACRITHQLGFRFVQKLVGSVNTGNMVESLQSLASLGPLAISISPYLAAMGTQHKDEQFMREVAERFPAAAHLKHRSSSRGWLTDTFIDMNGVSHTIRQMAGVAARNGRPLEVITSLASTPTADFPLTNFKPIGEFGLPEYEQQRIGLPPFLEMVAHLEERKFRELIISTPGTVGLTALAAAKLLGMRTVGIYHTDFPMHVRYLTDDHGLAQLTWRYMLWFYGQMDQVAVPSESYRLQLLDAGMDADRVFVMPRGIDTRQFNPRHRVPGFWRQYGLGEGTTLVYVGRISLEKNLRQLIEEFTDARRASGQRLNLAIVGQGPLLDELKKLRAPGVAFTGALSGTALSRAYASGDVFVFPSTTDTFGNSVLEAMASGLPAIVTDRGGPSELVRHEVDGLVINPDKPGALTQAILNITTDGARRIRMAEAVLNSPMIRDWESVFADFWRHLDLAGDQASSGPARRSIRFELAPQRNGSLD
ncbi:MAG: glycosyltransferase [Phycisphaeraceae bacterium]|nr:glycosyltransferase [Phycisphaeraceae bacterium]